MRYMKATVFFCTFALLLASHANAQQMKLEIRDGRVSLDAQNVPVRQILAEWARVGAATIVNGEKVVGAPVTLQISGASERQALDIILRGVAGYMLAPRQTGSAGASAFDRILILPTSAGPRGNQPAGTVASPFNQPGFNQPGFNQPGFNQPGMAAGQPGMMGRPMPGQVVPPIQVEDDLNEEPTPEPEDDLDNDDDVPPVVFPRPGNRAGVPRRPNVFPTPTPQPGMPPQMPSQVPVPGEGQPNQPAVVSPGNPFGVPAGSGGTPGSITPVPQQTPRSR
jgi:hypothetical protein